MYVFPIFAVLTLGISFAVLRASYLEITANPIAVDALEGTNTAGANDGLLDHELASEDPIYAWLDRYLTPAAH